MNRTIRSSVVVAALALTASAGAQVQIESGHALDANLELGSGGYNGNVYRGPFSVPAYSTRYGAANQYGPYTNRWRQYSPYAGGAGQNWNDNRITNEDVYFTDRGYSAGWQSSSGGYSSYSGPPRGSTGVAPGGYSSSPGAYMINGRIGG